MLSLLKLINYFIVLICFSIFSSTSLAERVCKKDAQEAYNKLLPLAQKNDTDAMLKLSALTCDNCSIPEKTCRTESVRWLNKAAEYGNPKAQQLLIPNPSAELQDEDENPDHLFHVTQEIKQGDYLFRAYQNSGAIYFEILKNKTVVFSRSAKGMWFKGHLYQSSILQDEFPTLEVMHYSGGSSDYADIMYFSLNKTAPELKLHVTEGGYFDGVKDIGHHQYRWNFSDVNYRYWMTGGATSPIPDVILKYNNGKLSLDLNAMKKAPPSEQEFQQQVTAFHKEINKDTENKNPWWDDHSSLWGTALDLIYQGNPNEARRWIDLAWKKGAPGKQDFIDMLKAKIEKSPFARDLQPLIDQAFQNRSPPSRTSIR